MLHRRSQFWKGEVTTIPVPTFIEKLRTHRSYRLYAFVCLLANDRNLNCTVPLPNNLVNQVKVKLDNKTFDLAVNELVNQDFLRVSSELKSTLLKQPPLEQSKPASIEYELVHPVTARWLGTEWRYSPACRQIYRKELSPLTRTLEKVPTGEYESTGDSPNHNLYDGLQQCDPKEKHFPVPKYFLQRLPEYDSTTIRLYLSCIQMGRVINDQTDYMLRTTKLRDVCRLSAPTFRSVIQRLSEHKLAHITTEGLNSRVVLLNPKTGSTVGQIYENEGTAVNCMLTKEQVAEILRRLTDSEPYDLHDGRNFLAMMRCPACNGRTSGLKIGYKAGLRGSWWCDVCETGGGLEKLTQSLFGLMARAAFTNLS